MRETSYNIGLVINTDSVGWCITNSNNEVLRVKKKRTIGTYRFKEGQKALDRRLKRSARRTKNRRKQRIELLQDLLKRDIEIIDPLFFKRIEESFFKTEDKTSPARYMLFNDKNFTDKDFHKRFPTTYHLRKHLMTSTDKEDIRLIYLAVAHILKNRGNFLYSNELDVDGMDISNSLEKFCEKMGAGKPSAKEVEQIQKALTNGSLGKKERNAVLENTLPFAKSINKEIIKAITGDQFKFNAFVEDMEDPIKIKFSDDSWEEQKAAVEKNLGENFELVQILEGIYSQYVLSKLLGDKDSLSEAMIATFDKHHEQLKELKQLVKKYANEQYKFLFNTPSSDKKVLKNYVTYIEGNKNCTSKELYDSIKKIFKDVEMTAADTEKWNEIVEQMDNETYLEKLRTSKNSVVPNQLHKKELVKILENQAQYWDTIKENKDKIVQLSTFRIPYYVGPLNSNSQFSWVERTNEKIYPWNFFEVIDQQKTAKNFMDNLIGNCNYMEDKKVFPAQSLLYSKFKVLNELSNIRINERPLSAELKKKAYKDLFIDKYETITANKLKKWYKAETGEADFVLGGLDEKMNVKLDSYHAFKTILGEITDENEPIIEDIITWLTVYPEKQIIEKLIIDHYPNRFTQKEIDKMLSLSFTGWSKFSKEFLTQVTTVVQGNHRNIMYYLENTPMNFMQVITNKDLAFRGYIEELQNKKLGEKITLKDIETLQVAPTIKKSLWQAVQIIEEIISIMGAAPKNIMLNVPSTKFMASSNASRKKRIEKAYKEYEKDYGLDKQLYKELKSNATELQNDKVFLYFLQLGKCALTGENLSINNLEACHVVKIIPEYYTRDNSIENKVLVIADSDKRKDNLLLEHSIQNQQKTWWNQLYRCNLMGIKKFTNLTKEGFDQNEQLRMIRNQIIEKSQIVKNIARLIDNCYVNTNVVLVNANLIERFREKYEIPTMYNVNYNYIAQNAYLSTVIGNTLLSNKDYSVDEWIYGKYLKYKNEKLQNKNYIMSMFDRQITNENGRVIWDGENSVEQIKKVFGYKNYILVRKLEEHTGNFYKETVFGHKENKKLIPLKEGMDATKYGGYSNTAYAYITIFEYTKNGKRVKTLLPVPTKISYDIKSGKTTLEEYLNNEYQDVRIIKAQILKNQLIELNGSKAYLISDRALNNAEQLYLSEKAIEVINLINENKWNQLEQLDNEVSETMDEVLEKINTRFPLLAAVYKNISEVDYRKLDVQNRGILISEVLRTTMPDASYGYPERAGVAVPQIGRVSKSINLDKDSLVFINQSRTGLHENRDQI